MKLAIKTEKLKEMISRAVKGAGCNKLIPITSLIAIESENGVLRLITTDATNYLYIIDDKAATEDFYACVDVTVFSKLISKMTCENVTLEIKDAIDVLEIRGNGNYKIELPLDENGAPIIYPDPVANLDLDGDSACTINRSTINVILETVKPALAVTLDNPCYTGYYVGKRVVATDTYKIASMDVELLNEPRLISAEMLDLLAVMTDEKIVTNIVGDDDVVFSTPDCVVYGKFMEGIEDYAIDAISDLVDTEFDSFCSVPKAPLVQLLDRLSLFVGTYDKNAVDLTFTRTGLQVSSKKASGVEIIDYTASDNFRDFICSVDIQMLTQEIKAISNDVIEMYYGEDNAIKMTDGNITIIVALMDEDGVEE